MSRWPSRHIRANQWERRFDAIQKREPKLRKKFNVIIMEGRMRRIYRSMHQFAGGRFLRLQTRLQMFRERRDG